MAEVTNRPDAIGTNSEWTPTSGNNYANVDESSPDEDTTRITAATTGLADSYGFDTAIPAGATSISGVVWARAKSSGVGILQSVCRSDSTESTGSDTTDLLTASYVDYELDPDTPWSTDPATSSAWTVADYNAAEWGVFSVWGSGAISVTQVWLVTTYTPATGVAPTKTITYARRRK